MKGWLLRCCDCGLVHSFNFYIVDGGVEFKAWRLMKKHPGFKAVQKKIAKKYGMKAAGAILASKTRSASKVAKKKNPRLKKVK